jgi:hypothetical protein
LGLFLALVFSCGAPPHDDEDGDSGEAGSGIFPPGSGGTRNTGGSGGDAASGGAGDSAAGGEGPDSGGSTASGGDGGNVTTGGSAGNGGDGARAGDGGTSGGIGGGGSGAGGTAGSSGGAGMGGANMGGAGSSSGGASGAGAGGGGSGGMGACGNLIDDMEAGTGYICQGNGRTGSWFSYYGTLSTLSPAGYPVPTSIVSPARGTSQRAMRLYGTRGDYAGFGCWLTTVPITYDGSAFTGIRFYAKGTPASLRVIVQTSATESTTYGGTCTLPTLSCAGNETQVTLSASAWTLYSVPFSSLVGGTATFNVRDIWSIEFQPGANVAYDYWIDDLSFY